MFYPRNHITFILIGLVLFAACSNGDDRKTKSEETEVPNSSENFSTSITTQDLLSASLEGRIELIQDAVEQDIDIDSSDQTGRTPLMLASYNGHYTIVKYLLENGADPKASDNQGRTSLTFAASGPFPDTVELLLKNGADPNKTDKVEGWSALMWAAAEGNEKVVSVLLNHGADPTLRDKDNETASDFAVNNGHNKIAGLLKEAVNKKSYE